MLSGDNISSFATDGGGCASFGGSKGRFRETRTIRGWGGGRCRTSRRAPRDASSSAVTGMRGCFVSPEAMRFTTNFDLVRISIAVRASCTSESGRGLGVSAGCSRSARDGGRDRPDREAPRIRSTARGRPVHSVPQPRFSVNRTPVRRANQTKRNIAKSFISVYRRAATASRSGRETLADQTEYAQTAKGTPLCKHRDMPSETLVRNSSYSSPRRGGARSNPGYVACGRKRAERRTSASSGFSSRRIRVEKKYPLVRAGLAGVLVLAPIFSFPRRATARGVLEFIGISVYRHTSGYEVIARATGAHADDLAVATESLDVLGWAEERVGGLRFFRIRGCAGGGRGSAGPGEIGSRSETSRVF